MRWRLYGGLALVVALSIAAVVVAIAHVTGSSDLARIKSALGLQTNCPHIAVRRPSRALIVKRWAGLTVQSADVACSPAGPRVTYAKFIDRTRLDRAVAASPPSGGYCLLANAIVVAQLAGVASTVLSDVCQSLAGTLVMASADAPLAAGVVSSQAPRAMVLVRGWGWSRWRVTG
jgi:hypothetical protein